VFAELLKHWLKGCLELSCQQIEALEAHYHLLVQWNRTVNLTSIHDEKEVVERHYCESLFLGSFLPRYCRVADIGSGAGFPGFPVAILRPDCEVTLVESHQRKAVFLRECTRHLKNVRVRAERAEDLGRQFDWVISRAVSYEDLAPILKEVAPNAELLTGAEEPTAEMGFDWRRPIPLPWGKQRFLRIGNVSRETAT